MPTYVWIAKNSLGNSVTREVTTDTVEESREVLLAEGCTDLSLMTDDIMAAASSGMPNTITLFDEEIKITEADKLKHRNKKPATFLRVLWDGMWQSKQLLFGILVLGAWQAYRGSTLGLVLTGVGLLAWLAFILVVSLPSIYYDRLHRAADWHRWDEVLDAVEALEKIGQFHFIKVPAPELGRYRAKALAARGHLNEALAGYAQFENQPGCPRWLYLAFVASLHDLAKQYDLGLGYTLKAIQEKNNPVLFLDLANRYARRKKDAVRARAALVEAEKGIIPDVVKAGHLRYRGIVAYVEGDYAGAKKELESSLEVMEQNRNQPYRDGSINIARAYLCCVLARLGDTEGARSNLAAARDYLAATGETELLQECKQMAGV